MTQSACTAAILVVEVFSLCLVKLLRLSQAVLMALVIAVVVVWRVVGIAVEIVVEAVWLDVVVGSAMNEGRMVDELGIGNWRLGAFGSLRCFLLINGFGARRLYDSGSKTWNCYIL